MSTRTQPTAACSAPRIRAAAAPVALARTAARVGHRPVADPAGRARLLPGQCGERKNREPRVVGRRADQLCAPGRPGPAEARQLAGGLGRLLAEHRAAVGISRRQLAGLAGCCASMLSRLEVGARRPSTELLGVLAHALVVPPGYGPHQFAGQVEALTVALAHAAGGSLVESTPGGARRRRRRLRRARLAADAAAVPVLRELVDRRQLVARVLTLAESEALRRAAWATVPQPPHPRKDHRLDPHT
jgi:transcriptional regulator with XRE-family HTH domain